ncbi:MAG TPA: translocation/assembly module TamB domain-containing protein [Candidatus Elarobacter sp.]|nr:translocation/assembly module TamB domain-containing protein [Candidatus Elarobacter sp.]
MRASRRAVIVAAAVAALLVVVIAARHAITRAVLQTVLSGATGYQVSIGEQRLGTNHAALFDVHVVKNGDPVLDAQRVDVDYALRDIFPGGQHRFGFAAISIQKPVLTITRHADGTLTFNRKGGTSGTPPAPTRKAAAPYYFTARVRDGVIRLVDAAPLQRDLAYQTIEHVSIDASVKSDARTTAKVDGVLLGRRAPGAALERYPLSERTVIDVQRGIALNRITARELPMRGALGFFIHSKTFRFDDGVLDAVDARYYALAPKAGEEFAYKLGGGAQLRGGALYVSSLAHEIRNVDAPLVITDDMLAAPAIGATINGIPVRGRGAMYALFSDPTFRLGFTGSSDLHDVRSLFTFLAKMPLSGGSHFETLLASSMAKPLIRTRFSAAHVAYDKYPADGVDGLIDYYDGAITFGAVRARYGSVDVGIGGRVILGNDGKNDVLIAVNATGAGSALPYADMLAPDASVIATVLLSEPPGQQFNARGTIGAVGRTTGAGTFSVDQKGVGEFGPLAFTRSNGESFAGGFELQRPISQSAGWIHARNFRLADVRNGAMLPGGIAAAMPPIAGVIDGDFAGGGTPDAFGLAGAMHGYDLRYGPYALGSGSVRLGGTFSDIRLSEIDLAGPLGRFNGAGAYDGDVFALEGRYDGRLENLRPFIADASAQGEVHGPIRATIGPRRIVVQTTGADLPGARIRGVAVDHVAGTLAVDNGKTLRLLAANGSIGGAQVVAADAGGPFLVSAPAVPVSALRGAGLPLQGGTLAFYGLADIRGGAPSFDGLVSVEDGRAAGYPISGGADLALAGGTATVRRGVAALGTTYGNFDGRVFGIGSSGPNALAYDLNAQVPIGDVGEMRRALRLPVKYLEGSFSADVRVRGNGARPRIAGAVAVPEGSYNGLDFKDARAGVAITTSSVAANHGVVTVGSTHANVDAAVSVARGAFDVDVRSANANLADFDDYFDEAETLAGTGPVALMFANDGVSTRTSGRLAVTGFRYRRFTLGQTNANWSQRGSAVVAALNVRGSHGALRANGSVIPARGGPVRAIEQAWYRANASAQQVDLGTWLPPFGVTAPILGQVSASGTIAGRWPRLGVNGDATLANGSLFGYKVVSATAHARGDGSRIALSNTDLDLGFARFNATGSFGLTPAAPLALSVRAQSPDVEKALVALFPKGPRYDVGGAVTANALLGGSFAKPRATVGFEMTGARYKTLAIPRVLGNVAYDGKTLNVNDAEATFAKGNVVVTGLLPLTLQPLGVTRDAPLSFSVALSGLDLAPFAPFVPGAHTKLGGTADGTLSIEGTAGAPRLAGTIALANGLYVSDLDRAAITNANARLAFSGTSVALEALHANVGGGTLDGGGRLDLPLPGTRAGNYAIGLTAHGARVDSPTYGRGVVDGTMRLRSATPRPVLSGDVTLTNASIPILSIYRSANGGGGNGGGAAGGLPFDLALNIAAHAGKNVRVQASSPYIDIGTTGTVDLTGTLSSPKLAGVLTATPGGVFSTYNRAFRVQQAAVAFNPQNGLLPYIDLRAYAHVTNPDPDPTRNAVGSADITVTVDGPADELAAGTGSVIQYSSNPPYSQEQIIGLLLDASVFGAVNFGQQQNGTTLRGAPGESNVLLPPGVTAYQAGAINFNQEAFSVLNGQLTQRFLAPVERLFTGRFGLTDFELTVDYGGGVGYNALKQLGKRDVYASFGQTLSRPVRTQLGFTARPDATTSVQFSYFTANGLPAITNNANGTSAFNGTQRLQGIQPVSNRQGFTFSIVRKYP